MAPPRHRRQVLLFLAAILLPCAALVILGLRLAIQEQELARARLGDERRGVVQALRQDLSSRLERTALRQAGILAAGPELLRAAAYDDSTVALVAAASGGRLALPWEQDERPAEARRVLGEGVFAERIRVAERAEFAAGDPARAAGLYRRALEVATSPVQAAHARLSLARSLAGAGRANDALEEYRRLVLAPPDVVDENGIPLSLYAASRLPETASVDTTILACARNALLAGNHWLAPPALYLLRDLVDRAIAAASAGGSGRAANELARDIGIRLARSEQALALQRIFPGLGLLPLEGASAASRQPWILHGSPPWLVGAVPAGEGDRSVVVAVRAQPVLASLEAGTAASPDVVGEVIVARPGATDEPLGAAFPGLSVRFTSADGRGLAPAGTVRRWFYLAGLALVLGVTLFGAYLLWRDVRREVELAQTRSRFVSAVSHELKTPLTAIRMFAETLQLGRPADRAAREEYLDTIVNESERLTRLLNNVLEFSRIEQGKTIYRLSERHSLAEIVRSSARAMRYPLEQQHFSLDVSVDDDVPSARVDPDAIEQAILNLLGNAMKYSGESRRIELRLGRRGDEAVIDVSDRGVGIPVDEQERIFERFYRIEGATHGSVPGAGLGLTLVRHIAEAHGGRVTVRSAPGEGSTFSLIVPLEGGEA